GSLLPVLPAVLPVLPPVLPVLLPAVRLPVFLQPVLLRVRRVLQLVLRVVSVLCRVSVSLPVSVPAVLLLGCVGERAAWSEAARRAGVSRRVLRRHRRSVRRRVPAARHSGRRARARDLHARLSHHQRAHAVPSGSDVSLQGRSAAAAGWIGA